MKNSVQIEINKQNLHYPSFCGWGTSLCWWAHRLGYDEGLSQKAADLFYGKDGLRLNIMRYNIGGGDNPAHNHITRTDSKIPGWLKINEKGEKIYDYNADKNQLNILTRCITAAGDDAFTEVFSNSPPYFMTVSGCSSGSHDAKSDNLKNDCVKDFAQYLCHVCAYMQNEMGIKIGSLAPMNEPNTAYWKENSPKQEGCHFDKGESQNRLLLAVKEEMIKSGLTAVDLTASDETSARLQLISCKSYSKEVWNAIDRVSTHTYEKADKRLKEYIKEKNFPLWMTETDWSHSIGLSSGEMGPGLWLSKKIIEDLSILAPQAWVMWQAIGGYTGTESFDGNYDGPPPDMNKGYWGLGYCDFDKKEIILSQKYYCFGQFTRYIRPGMKILPVDKRNIAAYDEKNNKLVLVCINTAKRSTTRSFNLNGFTLKGKAEVIRTRGIGEKKEQLKKLTSFDVNGNTIKLNLKGYSVTTYIFTVE